jgi:glucose-6-phosphate isomerase
MVMLRLNYYNMMTAPDLAGISASALAALVSKGQGIHHQLKVQQEQGNLYFCDILEQTPAELAAIQALAEQIRGRYENFVILGIGGSSLGPIAVHQALNGPFYNERVLQGSVSGPRMFFLDNVDPDTLATFLTTVDLTKTCFNAISKSGGTTETLAQLLWIIDQLKAVNPDSWKDQIILTTDPAQGSFRKLVEEFNFASLPIPFPLGGRYSVFSAVGLLPAAVTGLDITVLLNGAKAMRDLCQSPDLTQNPAYLLGTLHYLADQAGRNITIMMPYSDRLFGFAQWFGQLWAESLGKRYATSGEEVYTGQTPASSRGTTDQHSQVQLYAEGPKDKMITFLRLAQPTPAHKISSDGLGEAGFKFLVGAEFGQLLNAEQQAIEFALRQVGCISYTLELAELDTATLGAMIWIYEMATAFAGGLYGVNPLDQPGVELGKVLTFGLMGRAGYEAQKAAVLAYQEQRQQSPYLL